MKRICILLLMITLLLSGCVGGSSLSSRPMWSAKINGYHITADTIPSTLGDHEPDPGYEWLVFDVSVTNLTQEPQLLNLILVSNGFDFIAENGNKYTMSFVLFRPPGSLPEFYKAQQTQSGNVHFEVPIGTNVKQGKLIFKAIDNPKDIVFDLSTLSELPKTEMPIGD